MENSKEASLVRGLGPLLGWGGLAAAGGTRPEARGKRLLVGTVKTEAREADGSV